MKIGVIGSGMIGGTVGLLLVEAGDDVLFASRHPDQLAKSLGRSVRTGTPLEAAKHREALRLSLPVGAIATLPQDVRGALVGKVVLDTSNPYAERDGTAAAAALAEPGGTGTWTAHQLPGAQVVKALNTVYFQVLKDRARRGAPDLGIPIAGDDERALALAE